MSYLTDFFARPDGFLGYTGSFGYTGSVGFTGSFGDTGYSGSRGFTGSFGYTGSVGFTGSQGYTGSVGVIGFTGSYNLGYTGSVGFTGSRGDIGYAGSGGFAPHAYCKTALAGVLQANSFNIASATNQTTGVIRVTLSSPVSSSTRALALVTPGGLDVTYEIGVQWVNTTVLEIRTTWNSGFTASNTSIVIYDI